MMTLSALLANIAAACLRQHHHQLGFYFSVWISIQIQIYAIGAECLPIRHQLQCMYRKLNITALMGAIDTPTIKYPSYFLIVIIIFHTNNLYNAKQAIMIRYFLQYFGDKRKSCGTHRSLNSKLCFVENENITRGCLVGPGSRCDVSNKQRLKNKKRFTGYNLLRSIRFIEDKVDGYMNNRTVGSSKDW